MWVNTAGQRVFSVILLDRFVRVCPGAVIRPAGPEGTGSPNQSVSKGLGVSESERLPGPGLHYWEWQLRAACRGMDSSLFFPSPDERNTARARRTAKAKAVCRDCPAIMECRAHALRVHEPYGIWGGLSEDEREEVLAMLATRSPGRRTDVARG